MAKSHDLKCWPEPFNLVWEGKKKFELRRDDRGFKVHDILVLREYDPVTHAWSKRQITCVVTCIIKGFGLEPDFVALGIQVLVRKEIK